MRWLAAGCLFVVSAWAAEHSGQVLFSGLPVPGVTLIATQGERNSRPQQISKAFTNLLI
jgi:hypothetical protein